MNRIAKKEGCGRLARNSVAAASCRKPSRDFPAFIPSLLSIPVPFPKPPTKNSVHPTSAMVSFRRPDG
jgi:hypothetical protein